MFIVRGTVIFIRLIKYVMFLYALFIELDIFRLLLLILIGDIENAVSENRVEAISPITIPKTAI